MSPRQVRILLIALLAVAGVAVAHRRQTEVVAPRMRGTWAPV